MQRFQRFVRTVSLVGQLGFTIITPPLLLIWLSYRLVSNHNWPVGIIVAAIIIGFGCSVSSARKLLRSISSHHERTNASETQDAVSFNKHT